jgi:Domain of unknown function (DUF4411)
MTPYLVDTNFFIQAHRVNFPMDVVPGFWIKVKELADAGKIISIDKVKRELYNNEDQLKIWCEDNLPKDFFKDSTGILNSYSQIVNWAATKDQYTQQALEKFLDADEADAWLIAYAHAQNISIVTNEVSARNSKNSIKIPDVCERFGVKYSNPIQMFRELGERF